MRAKAIVVIMAGLLSPPLATVAAQERGDTGKAHAPKLNAPMTPMRVEIRDGQRFHDIESKRLFRLAGIETCAPTQTAELNGQSWPCGVMAMAWLVNATLGKWVACAVLKETGEEYSARCSTSAHPDLALAMIRDGYAVMAPADQGLTVPRSYGAAELQAKKSHLGIWSSRFDMPWDYALTQKAPVHAKTGVASDD